MGRFVIFSTIFVAGLVQMPPVIAQDQLSTPDAAPSQQAHPAGPVPEAKIAERQPESGTASKHPDARDPADRDLAVVPPEEPRPGLVDPSVVRRLLGKAEPVAPTPAEAGASSEPVLAAAESVPKTAPVAPASEPAPPAATSAAVAPLPAPVADDRAPAPVYAETDINAAPGYSDDEPGPQDRDIRGRAIYSDRAQAPADGGYDDGAGDQRPVYAEDRAYPGDDDRAGDRDERYALQDRALPSAAGMPNPWVRAARERWRASYRPAERGCDDGRAEQLLRHVRREADLGMIDRRAARDLQDEIDHAVDLQGSYCASGMNDWRRDRIDRQFAQIEDRIRYEEDQGGYR